MTRGQACDAVRKSLEDLELYLGESDKQEEVIWTKFRDIASVRRVCEVKTDSGDINLRKPFLFVNMGNADIAGPNISISANVNMEACDNKMIDEVGGRTGGFCTACTAVENDMHGDRAKSPFLMNMGADKVWDHFNDLYSKLGDSDVPLEDVVIPSARGDNRTRLGTKHAPLTNQLEFSKVNSDSFNYLSVSIIKSGLKLIIFFNSGAVCPTCYKASFV
jgi:hypothetical protein